MPSAFAVLRLITVSTAQQPTRHGKHADPTADKIGRHCRQQVVLTARPAELDRHVLAFDVTALGQASAERCKHSACENSRPIAAPTCATSLAGPSRSRRAISDACRLGGTAGVGDGSAAATYSALPSVCASSTALVISSTNRGMPSVRAIMSCRMFAGRSLLPMRVYLQRDAGGRGKRVARVRAQAAAAAIGAIMLQKTQVRDDPTRPDQDLRPG
jgi:hypothetical protein